jgi:hypothetical protein
VPLRPNSCGAEGIGPRKGRVEGAPPLLPQLVGRNRANRIALNATKQQAPVPQPQRRRFLKLWGVLPTSHQRRRASTASRQPPAVVVVVVVVGGGGLARADSASRTPPRPPHQLGVDRKPQAAAADTAHTAAAILSTRIIPTQGTIQSHLPNARPLRLVCSLQ